MEALCQLSYSPGTIPERVRELARERARERGQASRGASATSSYALGGVEGRRPGTINFR